MKNESPKTPFEAAMKLIESDVRRGISVKAIRRGQPGWFDGDFDAQVSGYMPTGGKKYGPDKILVFQVNGKPVQEVFSLAEVYKAVKNNLPKP